MGAYTKHNLLNRFSAPLRRKTCTRKEYAVALLCATLLVLFLFALYFWTAGGFLSFLLFFFLLWTFGLFEQFVVFVILLLAAAWILALPFHIKRLRDIGRSPWWVLPGLVPHFAPFVHPIMIVYLLFARGTKKR